MLFATAVFTTGTAFTGSAASTCRLMFEPASASFPAAAGPSELLPRRSVSWFERIAPSTETPIPLPRVRLNVTEVVATPRFFRSTTFWTAIVSVGMTNPSPVTNMKRLDRSWVVAGPIVERR